MRKGETDGPAVPDPRGGWGGGTEGVVRVAVDGLGLALRRQLGLGRLLPLGEPSDGLWLAEQAAVPVWEEAAASVTGVRLGTVRLGPDEAEAAGAPAVPPPPSALPPGPLRIGAQFVADLTATGGESLTGTAARLREALVEAAHHRLGLPVVAVDLHVTAVGEADPGTDRARPEASTGAGPARWTAAPARPDGAGDPDPAAPSGAPHSPDASGSGGFGDLVEVVSRAASTVPGAVRVRPARTLPHASWLAAAPAPKRQAPSAPGPGAAPGSGTGDGDGRPHGRHPTGHLLLHLTVTADRRVADVAREVREAVRSSLTGQAAPHTIAVLVTELAAA